MKKTILGLLIGLSLISSVSCNSKKSKAKESNTTKTVNTTSEKENKMNVLNGKDGLYAVLETEKGTITMELFYKKTPMTVMNFVGLAEGTLDAAKGKPFYDGLKFHRVIADFMIQGGDPKGNGTGGPGYKFPDEFVDELIFDKPGKLAMANSGADTNGSQFFITHVPTDWLNHKHTIFGEVVDAESQKVVDKVAQNDTIISLKIVRQGDEAKAFTATQAAFDKAIEDAKVANAEKAKAKMAKVIEGCTETKEGIFYKVLEKGNGTKVGEGKLVTVDYRVYTVAGPETVFDASIGFHPQGHDPLDFTTGAGQMIKGFDLMVQDMEYGEVRHMILPPNMAYGPRGIPQVGIGGTDYIVFDVKVIK